MKLQVLILSVASALFFQGVAAAPSEAAPAACKTSTCNKNVRRRDMLLQSSS